MQSKQKDRNQQKEMAGRCKRNASAEKQSKTYSSANFSRFQAIRIVRNNGIHACKKI